MMSPSASPEFNPVKSKIIVVSIIFPRVITECFTIAVATDVIPVPAVITALLRAIPPVADIVYAPSMRLAILTNYQEYNCSMD